MIKYLFLDCDGVLNCESSLCVREGTKSSVYILDLRKVDLLNEIVAETGCKIILSSTWRLDPEGIATLMYHGVNIHDMTTTRYDIRGRQIQEFMKEFPCDRYAIVDDDSDMLLEQLPYFFQTDPDYGLTRNIAYRIKYHLNNGRTINVK